MTSNFVPGFHFDPPSSKLTPEWAKKAIDYCWHNTGNHSLLEGKNVVEIEEYASGNYSMKPFEKLHKKAKKQLEEKDKNAPPDLDLQFMPVPLIPTKLNSAEATVQKIPTEVSVTAIDALAAEKKQEDLNFLRNKPKIENDLQDVADRLQLDKVDLGTTKHSAVPFASAPYDLDLNEPDELQVFVDLLYSLSIEEAFETLLEVFHTLKKTDQIRYLETRDQMRYAVSTHLAFQNSITGLPDAQYEYPGNFKVPHSDLPDYSDNSHRFICRKVTPLQLFNFFSSEIGSEEQLELIVNGGIGGLGGQGYCACNTNGKPQPETCPRSNWNSFKMELIYCEVISVDSLDVVTAKMGDDMVSYFSAGHEKVNVDNVSGKVWGQNTYCFWWLRNTTHFFGLHKLGFAHRKRGQESFINFSSNIYKSQQRGCVELAIPENKKAQVAYIKMMYALIMSLPAGKVIDLKGMKSAIESLKENPDYTLSTILEMALRDNLIIIDTEGFDGKNDGQLKPFYEIPGGLKTEINGYMEILRDADQKISQYTGINEALTGQSASPDALIGLEKLRINQSLNALYYVTAAMQNQYQCLFNVWSSILQDGIKEGGEVKKAIINFIGSQKVSIIDGLNDLPLHTMGVKITLSQREEERAKFEQTIYQLKAQGVIKVADEYMLSALKNPKDKFRYLAVKEKQFMKRLEKQKQDEYAQQQQLATQQGQNIVAGKQAEAQGEKQLVYAKGEVQAKILQLASQLNMNQAQTQALVQKQLDFQKQQAQLQKSVQTLQTKHELENQSAYQ